MRKNHLGQTGIRPLVNAYYWIIAEEGDKPEIAKYDVPLSTFIRFLENSLDKPYLVLSKVDLIIPNGNKSTCLLKILESLEINEYFNTEYFIRTVWGDYDEFIRRSFDVLFYNTRNKLSDRKFKVVRGEGIIIRTS